MTELRLVGRDGRLAELSEIPDGALLLLARDGVMEAMAEQQRRLSLRRDPDTVGARFNPNHDDKGHFSSGPGGGGGSGGGSTKDGGGKATGSSGGTGAITQALADGRPTSCTTDQIAPLMKDMASGPSTNLANLSVKGAGNQNMFSSHLREIPRSEMPQLPGTVAELKPFADKLNAMGVTAEMEQVDPRELKMTQNQLDSTKVGKMFGYMKAGGWQAGGALIISKENAILDGHHRWAGAAAVAATGQAIKVNALKVNLGIDELLKVAQTVSGPRKAMGAA